MRNSVKSLLIGAGRLSATSLSPSEDTYIAKADPTTNFKAQSVLRIQNDATVEYHALLAFDLSSLAGKIAAFSLLTLTVATSPTEDEHTVSVHEVEAASEFTSDATWDTRDGSLPWAGDTGADGGEDAGCSVAGTDYAVSAAGVLVVPDAAEVGTQFTVEFSGADTQAWVDAGAVQLVLLTDVEASTLIVGSGGAVAAYRPQLRVVYKR